MLSQYAFIGIFAIIAFALPIIGLVLAWLLRPKKPNPAKNATYECGMETIGDTWVQFKAQYYLLRPDLRGVRRRGDLHFPLGRRLQQARAVRLVEMVLFVAILVGGLLYAWRKGAGVASSRVLLSIAVAVTASAL